MLTVPEAARRTGRNPETIRRWIRTGRLRAQKVGTQHVINEEDLAGVVGRTSELPLPPRWARTWAGDRMPDWVELVRDSRGSR